MTTFSRRTLLQGGLAAGAALLAGGSAAARASASGSRILRPPARRALRAADSLPFPSIAAGTDTLPQIEHILVLMMENHSYDNYLGMLGRGPGLTPRGDGFTLGTDGLPTASNPNGTGGIQRAFHMPTDCQLPSKPGQEWAWSHESWDNGKLDGFVTSPSGPVSMGYWTGDDLPFYYSLATTFPVGDRWFCSVLGQTYPNRRYLVAATSVGMVDDVMSQLSTPPPNGTIFDRLDHYGISWRDYYHTSTQPTTGVFDTDPSNASPNVVPIDEFFSDAASGNLPGFAIIDPEFDVQSEENPQDIAHGEAFVAQVVDAVMQSPAWGSTLLVWTYDEHGGYYDHVPPPAAVAPDAIAPILPAGEQAYNGFAQYGFRVPSVVISPYAKRDYVSSVVYDHTSILAMVERKWNLPALTLRDANANDLSDFLDLSAPSFPEPPLLAAPATFPQACETTGPGTIPPAGSFT